MNILFYRYNSICEPAILHTFQTLGLNVIEELPLRIFDILGCGGFCMTNYQAELPEYFEIGTDLEAYSSMDELIDKCSYYLERETQRRQIAQNGYEKVCRQYNYLQRVKEMIAIASS